MTAAAVELAAGILGGLYACRDAGSESLLEYSPDYAVERAADVVDRCAKLGPELPGSRATALLPLSHCCVRRRTRRHRSR